MVFGYWIPSTIHAHAVENMVLYHFGLNWSISEWQNMYVNVYSSIHQAQILPCRLELTAAGSSDRFKKLGCQCICGRMCFLLCSQWRKKCVLSQHRTTLAWHLPCKLNLGHQWSIWPVTKSLLVLLRVHSVSSRKRCKHTLEWYVHGYVLASCYS